MLPPNPEGARAGKMLGPIFHDTSAKPEGRSGSQMDMYFAFTPAARGCTCRKTARTKSIVEEAAVAPPNQNSGGLLESPKLHAHQL